MRFRPTRGQRGHVKKYNKSEIDYFAIFFKERDEIYIFPVEEVCNSNEICIYLYNKCKNKKFDNLYKRLLDNFKF